ncbi:Uncharacterised protein [Mycobacterium tuberculosis]|uniref:Uncharacterized protein n=1 Tax=Mycobacterium tuberculosis TaxID=1773 RepID=A0A0T7LDD7_MYCTX|nr:Uncharacterised protein [Mycobacterium tuberculosis]CFA21020.1 Uncharacterised protein [Mycobacterium tuberculosis]CFA21348.1 Uncharacterised protein [Mycobacterium tuberculosis]CFA27463.1 Uncharacterised protein [Mycobacterium tuberculosis]CFA94752.1 Uncharacterised protein [Mycobacterium tuberculosis]
MVLPTLATPDPSAPTFPKPESPEVAEARFQKPEAPPPKLPKPEAVPAPALKKPDDGLVVEFPKPGAAGILMSGMLTPPTMPVRLPSIVVVGPPTVIVTVGRVSVDCGSSTGP